MKGPFGWLQGPQQSAYALSFMNNFREMAFLADQALDRFIEGDGKPVMITAHDPTIGLDDIIKIEQGEAYRNRLSHSDLTIRLDEHPPCTDIFYDVSKCPFQNGIFNDDKGGSSRKLTLFRRVLHFQFTLSGNKRVHLHLHTDVNAVNSAAWASDPNR
jgi:hypothetical protein